MLDNVVIPRDYPEVSTKSVDKTIQGSLTFVETCATLTIHPVQGWSVEHDQELVKCDVARCPENHVLCFCQISRSEVDRPEVAEYKAEDLHDYPPRIVCRFFPEENAPKRTTCTISLSGLLPQVKVHLPLRAPAPPKVETPTPPKVVVDTTRLQVC